MTQSKPSRNSRRQTPFAPAAAAAARFSSRAARADECNTAPRHASTRTGRNTSTSASRCTHRRRRRRQRHRRRQRWTTRTSLAGAGTKPSTNTSLLKLLLFRRPRGPDVRTLPAAPGRCNSRRAARATRRSIARRSASTRTGASTARRASASSTFCAGRRRPRPPLPQRRRRITSLRSRSRPLRAPTTRSFPHCRRHPTSLVSHSSKLARWIPSFPT